MDGSEFIRRVRKIARENNIAVDFIKSRGKGSHGTIYYGDRYTIVKDRKKEIGKGLLNKMLKDLDISFD
ncbi:MAG: hypothetical protein A2W28_12030 [Gammaproteobacteria bacterium RBG_16_51_14]|nr:MAG: hypothetical protein A2W28_12030 [Gammaproteobacteria bacterium RBG_16_51_14]